MAGASASPAATIQEKHNRRSMWPPFVRNILLPTQEALLGRPTFSILARLREQSGASAEYIGAYRAREMASLVHSARASCPYWQQMSRLDDALPILTRAEISRHRESMRAVGTRGKVIRHTSSGTTDDNLIFYLDRHRQAWSRALRMHALARLGVEVGEKQLHFWPHFPSGGRLGPLMDGTRWLRDRVTNDPYFDIRPLAAERLDRALHLLDRYQPAIIVGYPSGLFTLAQRRFSNDGHPGARPPRYVVSTGEVLYDFQRRAIESAFGAPVVEEYGSQDVGIIASENESGDWVVNWQHVVVEVLRNGRPALAGETGEIVATNLHSHVMPFIRYATGDVVTLPVGADPALALSVLPRIEGRTSDVIVATDGQIFSNRELVNELVRETQVTEFSLHQTAPDRVLCMTLRDGGWIGQEPKVTEVLRAALGRSLQVHWKIGSAFRTLKSGKRRYICSPVAQALIAHDRESGMFLSRAWPQLMISDKAA